MRELEIRAWKQSTTNKMALIIRQLEFVMTRQQATEEVLADELKGMFQKDAAWLKTRIDKKHEELLRQPTIIGANGHG